MTKQEFLMHLRKGLSGLPQEELEERIVFYGEMIDDRMEDGISEEAAVGEIGTVDELVPQIIAEIPLTKLVKEKITPKKKMNPWEIVLLALGSPIWLSILIASAAVIISLYVCLWTVIIAFWAIFASVVICGSACIIGGVAFVFGKNTLTGIAVISAGIVCAGLSIFLFYGCKAVMRGILMLTKKCTVLIKSCFMRKEEVQ